MSRLIKDTDLQGVYYFRERIVQAMRLFYLLPVISCAILIASCGGNDNPNRGKPIVLGDPATIVTETDSQYLQDFVADVKPVQQPVPLADSTPVQQAPEEPKQETAKAEKPEEKKPEAAKPVSAPTGKGLNVAFKELTLFIPNITTKTYRQQNLEKANGATYELASGNINGSQLKITGGNITKVAMRYQTVIVIKNELGKLPLESLSNTTDWKILKGSNNVFPIGGLDGKQLDYIKASPSAIRNAVSRSARNKRISKKTEQKWLASIKNVRAANQKPLVVVLRSVMWKVEGKDAKGKSYQKQLRLDIPL